MLRPANIQYELAERTRGMTYGGIGSMLLLVRKLELADPIDRRLHLLKIHLPYHESDHVLNFAFNALCDATCLEDLEPQPHRSQQGSSRKVQPSQHRRTLADKPEPDAPARAGGPGKGGLRFEAQHSVSLPGLSLSVSSGASVPVTSNTHGLSKHPSAVGKLRWVFAASDTSHFRPNIGHIR
jgi:hypothetical protein